MTWGQRVKPPDRRRSSNLTATVGGCDVTMTVGLYDSGNPCELFVDLPPSAGESLRGLTDAVAILTSFALQHGVPLEQLCDKFIHTKFAPAGPVQGHDRIAISTSILDFVFREMAITYLGREELAHTGGGA